MCISIPITEISKSFLSFRVKKKEVEEGQQKLTLLLGDYLNHWFQIISLYLDSDDGPEQ